MVAVPILSRAGDTIGVIVLHTEAPHEFTEDTLKLLVHIASLVSGAIENAQLYDQRAPPRRRRSPPSPRSAQEVAGAPATAELGPVVVPGHARLLGAEVCQLYRLEPTGRPGPARLRPPTPLAPPAACRPRACCWPRSTAGGDPARPRARCGPSSRSPTCSSPRCRPAASASACCAPARRRRRRLRRRGHRDRAGDRPPRGDRDQAGRADRGPDQGQHRSRTCSRRWPPAPRRSPRPRRPRCAAT